MKTKPPTIARPAMTPAERCVPSLLVSVEVEVEFEVKLFPLDIKKSITFCLTHSPKMQLSNCRPPPNACVILSCTNWQDTVPSEVEQLI